MSYDIDQIALEAAEKIEPLLRESLIGGRVQTRSRIQCIVTEAIREATADQDRTLTLIARLVDAVQDHEKDDETIATMAEAWALLGKEGKS